MTDSGELIRSSKGFSVLSDRITAIQDWVRRRLDWPDAVLEPASADASFRRYFRVQQGGASYIVMDAPPEKEDCGPFIHVTELFLAVGLHVPEILAKDLDQGLLLLSDLGSRLYLDALDETSVDRLYGDALGALATLQSCCPLDSGLPSYSRDLLMFEMSLFRDWLIGTHLGLELDARQQDALQRSFEALTCSALEQPSVCVHRDYHSRNLMVSARHNPGILDYQDAVIGPLTYDLVSLLRDCYIAWPRERLEAWMAEMHRRLGLDCSREEWVRQCDWMGLQRNIKIVGIFARLRYRDGKSGYLKMLPLFYRYLLDVLPRYPEFDDFRHILEQDECAP